METTPSTMSTKTMLIIAGVVLLLILIIGVAIYFFGRSAGKAVGSINVAPAIEDNKGGAQASISDILALSSQIHEDMNGSNLVGHDISLWQRVLTLSDTDLAKLYSEFNVKYQKDSGQTLVGWIDSEAHMPFDSWGTMKGILLPRFTKLNLK